MRKNNIARDQLIKSSERRIKHLMIQTLSKFEDRFNALAQSRDGEMFKSDLRTAFNDVIRAHRDELYDYTLEYQPIKFNTDNSLFVSKTFMETVQKIEFGIDKKPNFKIFAAPERFAVLDSLRAEIGVGVIYKEENNIILQVVGIKDCISGVLPFMDKYALHEKVKQNYINWRQVLVSFYKGDGDAKSI